MELDFTKLDSITPRKRLEDAQYTQMELSSISDEEGLKTQNTKAEEGSRTLDAYTKYQRNDRKSKKLQEDVLEGILAGTAPQLLLLKACKAISLMTDKPSFYDTAQTELASVYGDAFTEPLPEEWELDEVEERIRVLEKSLEKHKERRRALQEKLKTE